MILFHHVHGQTAGFHAFADDLRAAGHTVHTPDLFDGRTFATIEDGMTHVSELGFETIIERATSAADSYDGPAVFAGMSLGVVPAQMLAQTSDRARGALLLHSCVPISEFGDAWPTGVPVQIHAMDEDPFFVEDGDIDAARDLVSSTDEAELFLYPGDQHLFADSSLDSYDEASTRLLLTRVKDFLERI
ncbi:MAG: dienelactone hydrolase family protein [Acidimicrobiia bacterium]|nr:dienelactone hydrolase family protein [Acidimicrobiia bacterium]